MTLRTIHSLLGRMIEAQTVEELLDVGELGATLDLADEDKRILREFYLARKLELTAEPEVA